MKKILTASLVMLLFVVSACTDKQSGSESADKSNVNGKIEVSSTDSMCDLSSHTAPAGNVTFEIKNEGSKITEFYVYKEDGTTVVGEEENIGPGLTKNLNVSLEEGSYVTACRPGMTGQGIRFEFSVTAAENTK